MDSAVVSEGSVFLPPAIGPDAPPRLFVLDRENGREEAWSALPSLLPKGTLVVVNDAATLPAALPLGKNEELRLVRYEGGMRWLAARLGPGDFRQRTEDRPPLLALPSRALVAGVSVTLSAVHLGQRLVLVDFPSRAEMWSAIFSQGHAIQYSHVPAALALWAVQTPYASEPWAVEMPSAGRGLSLRDILALRAAGIEVRALTHAAGISSTGDAAVDAVLPLPERYKISPETARAVQTARAERRPIVAVGTSVVRALEDAARHGGGVRAGTFEATLRLAAGDERLVVDGLLTGWHATDSSHFSLLQTFRPAAVLTRAVAAAAGMHSHEFGDDCLLVPL